MIQMTRDEFDTLQKFFETYEGGKRVLFSLVSKYSFEIRLVDNGSYQLLSGEIEE